MRSWRRLAVCYLFAQGLGASVWWLVLFFWPDSRAYFMAPGAPPSTLFSFLLPDLLLFVGSSLGAAVAFQRQRPWAIQLLWFHFGTAAYAGLYCWSLTALSQGEAYLGAILMTPPVIVPGLMIWGFSPRGVR